MNPPVNPAGCLEQLVQLSENQREERILILEQAAGNLREAVCGLSENQLETKYRNWTIRQIAFHLADSHIHSYVRFLWTLSEDHPTIKPYDETACAKLPTGKSGKIEVAVELLESLHRLWVILIRGMQPEQFQRSFFHPESQQDVTLDEAINYYAWHSKHHTAQINWLRNQKNW